MAECLDTVPSIQRLSDLLVCVNEALKLCVQFNVLTGKDVAVVLESGDFGGHVSVLTLHRLGRETKIVLLASVASKVIVSSTTPSLQIIEVG